MAVGPWLIVIASCVYGANAYILLTGNLDTVQGIAKGLENSSVARQIREILKEAVEESVNAKIKRASLRRKKHDEDDGDYRRKYSNDNITSGEFFAIHKDISPKTTKNHRPNLDNEEKNEQEIFEEQDKRDEVLLKTRSRRMKVDLDDVMALGNSASRYLRSLKEVFRDTKNPSESHSMET